MPFPAYNKRIIDKSESYNWCASVRVRARAHNAQANKWLKFGYLSLSPNEYLHWNLGQINVCKRKQRRRRKKINGQIVFESTFGRTIFRHMSEIHERTPTTTQSTVQSQRYELGETHRIKYRKQKPKSKVEKCARVRTKALRNNLIIKREWGRRVCGRRRISYWNHFINLSRNASFAFVDVRRHRFAVQAERIQSEPTQFHNLKQINFKCSQIDKVLRKNAWNDRRVNTGKRIGNVRDFVQMQETARTDNEIIDWLHMIDLAATVANLHLFAHHP